MDHFFIFAKKPIEMSEKKVRTRFAPSPTGPLHVGGVRTALFNYLYAKKHKGDFILRIEDTDQARYMKGAEEYIIESLNWCGLPLDEGVSKGGPFEPYRQSERKDIYTLHAAKLLETGNAYYAFDTPGELDEKRKAFEAEKKTFSYNQYTRLSMRNSLSLSNEETDSLINSGAPYVLRFRIPENRELVMHDLIRGEIKVNTAELDDKVLFKADGLPTYHLANVVDDHMMEISHVIRGEEWLPSLPLHYLLYEALGWEGSMPLFAHLPLILKPSGKGKLSKRDGDKEGFPVFPMAWKDPATGEFSRGYREDGYLPAAFINMLAFLGWNPATEKEIFSIGELVESFSLEQVGKAGARFDPEKAKWFNHQYLVQMDDRQTANEIKPILEKEGYAFTDDQLVKIVGLVKERANLLTDFIDLTSYFFKAPEVYDEKMARKMWKEKTPEIVNDIRYVIDGIDNFTPGEIERGIKQYIEKNELGFGKVMNPVRLALVGSNKGPALFDIISLLGKEEVKNRLDHALARL
jgi:glutamyl-tRNA synthetase